MIIDFILNGEDVSVNVKAIERMSAVLHDILGLTSVKSGCLSGNCGSCLVLQNGKLVNACLLPAFKARKSEIVTLEGFKETQEYQDILSGFSKAGVVTCGFCYAGKVLSAETVLERASDGDAGIISEGLSGCACRCTELSTLIRGVESAIERRRERKYGAER